MRPTNSQIGDFRENAYANLPSYLNDGMNHLAGGRYQAATEHFQSIPELTGFYLKKHPVIVSDTPKNIEEARIIMFNAAADQVDVKGLTWKKGPFNAMGLGDASIHLTSYTLQKNTSRSVRDYALYMQAIAGAEETTHALQGMCGMYVSPSMRNKLFRMDSNLSDAQNYPEHDVAQHFIDRRIPVPKGFMDKYDRWSHVVGKPRVLDSCPIID
ncbi:MAG: hypothetical protein ACK481_08605 [Candidatus Melainabacteria bacterium]|jgi:hypothetical protein